MSDIKLLVRVAVVVGMVASLMGCQSSSSTQKTQTSQYPKSSGSHGVRTPDKKLIAVTQSRDGVQDVLWNITRIGNKKALYFQSSPSILLQSKQNLIVGNTGCNVLSGRYSIQFSQAELQLHARAGHLSCDNALAQEADLMDALQRIRYFSVQHKKIHLLDANRKILIQAEKP